MKLTIASIGAAVVALAVGSPLACAALLGLAVVSLLLDRSGVLS